MRHHSQDGTSSEVSATCSGVSLVVVREWVEWIWCQYWAERAKSWMTWRRKLTRVLQSGAGGGGGAQLLGHVPTSLTEGIVARFRTMAIARVSVLTGHVLGSLIQTLLSIAAVVGVALLVGSEPTAGFGEWPGAIGALVVIILALTWLSVALAMVAKSVATRATCCRR
jgi:hypothetical protein